MGMVVEEEDVKLGGICRGSGRLLVCRMQDGESGGGSGDEGRRGGNNWRWWAS